MRTIDIELLLELTEIFARMVRDMSIVLFLVFLIERRN